MLVLVMVATKAAAEKRRFIVGAYAHATISCAFIRSKATTPLRRMSRQMK